MNDAKLQWVAERIQLYLDNELCQAETAELLNELNANPAYLEIFHKEQSFRAFIKSHIDKRKPSPDLIQSIKDRIKAAQAKHPERMVQV